MISLYTKAGSAAHEKTLAWSKGTYLALSLRAGKSEANIRPGTGRM
jgi:hypothetical protein